MDLFQFKDYRVYLLEYMNTQPAGIGNRLANELDVSASHISQVLAGTRHLSAEQALKLANYLKFNAIEKSYWMNLVSFNKSSEYELQKYFEGCLIEAQAEYRKNERAQLGLQKTAWCQELVAIFYSSWHFMAVFCILATKELWSLSSLAQRTNLPLARVQEILSFFREYRIVEEVEGSSYRLLNHDVAFLSEGDSRSHQAAILHNCKNFRRKALEAFEEVQFVEEREEYFQTVVGLISQEDYEELKRGLKEIIKKIHEKKSQSNGEKVVCLNIDLFNI